MNTIRECRPDEQATILEIINAAAQRYRGTIPADCWHEPYMSAPQLARDMGAGVRFWGCDDDDQLVAVMGIQRVKDVTLIRHAYVSPAAQGRGIGGALLAALDARGTGQMLVGTWAAASWAIRFYERHGFVAVDDPATLLRRYWSIPERQIETSVVLAKPPV
jgi:GNAT superfamily N-acetyltransferase